MNKRLMAADEPMTIRGPGFLGFSRAERGGGTKPQNPEASIRDMPPLAPAICLFACPLPDITHFPG